MSERQKTEIDAVLLAAVREAAEGQGRAESELLEEAVVAYLSFLAARDAFMVRSPEADTADIGRPIEEIYVDPPADPSTWRPRTVPQLLGLVERWQRSNGVEPLSDDEAMRLAVEEQHAMRGERGARR
jgi:hypothetical protein